MRFSIVLALAGATTTALASFSGSPETHLHHHRAVHVHASRFSKMIRASGFAKEALELADFKHDGNNGTVSHHYHHSNHTKAGYNGTVSHHHHHSNHTKAGYNGTVFHHHHHSNHTKAGINGTVSHLHSNHTKASAASLKKLKEEHESTGGKNGTNTTGVDVPHHRFGNATLKESTEGRNGTNTTVYTTEVGKTANVTSVSAVVIETGKGSMVLNSTSTHSTSAAVATNTTGGKSDSATASSSGSGASSTHTATSLKTTSSPVSSGLKVSSAQSTSSAAKTASTTSPASIHSSTSSSVKSSHALSFPVVKASSSVTSAAGSTASATSGPTGAISDILTAHNVARASHGANPLTWSDSLTSLAKTWADACIWEHGGADGAGQNLASEGGTGGSASESGSQVVAAWMSEESAYDPANPVYSHFTQVVWKASTQLGCFQATCSTFVDGSGALVFPTEYLPAKYTVCNYSPAGNVEGEFGQNVQKNS
ncbi:MAG: hypothetical protein CYPHOPRED_001584 [Cyphobasidiales sp. Tagirdzhanova-0007]|nr:MAG: hypothetical protein CYPHOPRED_001584 [Cyphobasidiales sp. Tagirdzhanova-0007]